MYYEVAESKVIQTLNSSNKFTQSEKQRLLVQIESVLSTLTFKVGGWSNSQIEMFYKQGQSNALQDLADIGSSIKISFSQVDKEAVAAIADDAFLKFGDSISWMSRDARKILDDAIKERLQALIAEGTITGETRVSISNKIAGELERSGMSGLIDKSGKKWNVKTYSRMLARTKLVEASTQGIVNTALKAGTDLVKVSNHIGECPLCRPWEGKILSLTGKDPRFKTLAHAKERGLFHPNCEHRLTLFFEEYAQNAAELVTASLS